MSWNRKGTFRKLFFGTAGEVDMIFGFEKEADALQWIKEKSQGWILENK